MQSKGGFFFLRIVVRGSVIFLVLIYFVHTQLSNQSLLPTEPAKKPQLTFTARLAKKAKITERQAKILLQNLGPEMARELQKGNRIQIPELGTFRAETFTSKYFFGEDGSAKEYRNYKDINFVPSEELIHVLNPNAPINHPATTTPVPPEQQVRFKKIY